MAIKILAVSDGVVPTGLARVTHSVLSRLPRGDYEIHHLAVNYRGDPHDVPWKVYPAGVSGNIYGFNRLNELMKNIEPKIIFLLNDLWIEAKYLEILKNQWRSARIAMWVLVESDGYDTDWFKDVGIVDSLVACSEFGKSEMEKLLPVSLGNTKKISVIPFGIDHSNFFQIPGSEENGAAAKAQLDLLPEKDIPGSFIVLNANRNQPRKRIDRTLKAFSLFAKGKPDNVKLYLHMGMIDRGWNVMRLAERFQIQDRILISSSGTDIPSIANSDLNLVYNACDIGINTSTCEGWGLVSFEHAATGKAQIVPNVPSLRGLWGESALMAPIKTPMVTESLINGYLVDEEKIAEQLEMLYCDISKRKFVAQSCLNVALRPEYHWDSVASRWDEVFKSMAD